MTASRIPCLSLWQPWASLVVQGHKRIENRTWPPPAWIIGKQLWIHAAKRFDAAGSKALAEEAPDLAEVIAECSCDCPGGALLGSVTVVGCASWHQRPLGLTQEQDLDATFDPWFCGPWGWVLTDARVLEVPQALRGRQGIWWEQTPEVLR